MMWDGSALEEAKHAACMHTQNAAGASPIPARDVAGVSPVPARMWGQARSMQRSAYSAALQAHVRSGCTPQRVSQPQASSGMVVRCMEGVTTAGCLTGGVRGGVHGENGVI